MSTLRKKASHKQALIFELRKKGRTLYAVTSEKVS